jgi:hypothetical protein
MGGAESGGGSKRGVGQVKTSSIRRRRGLSVTALVNLCPTCQGFAPCSGRRVGSSSIVVTHPVADSADNAHCPPLYSTSLLPFVLPSTTLQLNYLLHHSTHSGNRDIERTRRTQDKDYTLGHPTILPVVANLPS